MLDLTPREFDLLCCPAERAGTVVTKRKLLTEGRGASTAGSTGLGLDIARRTAEAAAGGALRLGAQLPGSGAGWATTTGWL